MLGGLILVVLAAALWGTSGIATKSIYAFVDISPISVAAFRLALGAPLLLAAFRLTSGQRSFRIARANLAWIQTRSFAKRVIPYIVAAKPPMIM